MSVASRIPHAAPGWIVVLLPCLLWSGAAAVERLHPGAVAHDPPAPSMRLVERWRVSTSKAVSAAPALHGEMLYVGDWDGQFRAVNTRTGRTAWSFETGDLISGPPAAVDDDLVVFTSADSFLYALDARSGRQRWRFHTHSGYADQYGAALAESVVFVGSALGVHALDRRTGRVRWQVVTDGRPMGRPAMSSDRLYFATLQISTGSNVPEGFVYALEARTGRTVWRRLLPREGSRMGGGRAGVSLLDGRLLVPSAGGRVIAFDAASGERVWSYGFREPSLTASGSDRRRVFVGALDGHVAALDGVTGRPQWGFDAPGSIEQGPIAVGDSLAVFASGDSRMYGLDARTGALRFSRKGSFNPVVHDGIVYCGGFDADLTSYYLVALAIVADPIPPLRGGTP